MQKEYVILILGVWVAVLPYLGFPHSWKDILVTLSGLGFVCVSFMLYKKSKAGEVKEKTFDNFSENNFTEEGDIENKTNVEKK